VSSPAETHGAIVLMSWELLPGAVHPFGYVLPSLPAEMRFIRLDSTMLHERARLRDEVDALLRQHAGPIYLLTHSSRRSPLHRAALECATRRLHEYGLCVTEEPCGYVSGKSLDLAFWRVEPGENSFTWQAK